ncbi:hypothetical protein Mkiyose1088_55390 [Mycobacterium kiyosense]|nr:hypothetical protein Mkiyose1088_55390 [Mycobacterium kiyosense]
MHTRREVAGALRALRPAGLECLQKVACERGREGAKPHARREGAGSARARSPHDG